MRGREQWVTPVVVWDILSDSLDVGVEHVGEIGGDGDGPLTTGAVLQGRPFAGPVDEL